MCWDSASTQSLGRPVDFRKAVPDSESWYWSATCAPGCSSAQEQHGNFYIYILSQCKFTCFSDQDHSGSQCPETWQPSRGHTVQLFGQAHDQELPWSNCLHEDPWCSVIFLMHKEVKVPCHIISVQFISVQLLSHVRLFVTPRIAACQVSLSITNSRRSLKLMSIELVMPSSYLILCRPLLLLPPIPPSIRVFSNESTLHMK